MSNPADLAVTRVRLPLKFRLLEVKRVARVTPHLVRVTLTGDDLADFESASFDDHVKVFFPAPGEARPVLPSLGPNGPEFAEGAARPVARDFTPRRYDRARRELDIEFALHEAGPAAAWANQAQPGQWLGVGGPRGSFVVPLGFDAHVLIGDDTALPAIARRLQELPAGVPALVIAEVANAAARIGFETAADLQVVWRHRDDARPDAESPLLQAVRETALPAGEIYVWAAAEAAAIRAIHQHLREERGIGKHRLRASSYWKRGNAAVHETIDD